MQNNTINNTVNDHIKKHCSPKEHERETVSSEYELLCSFLNGNCIQSGSWGRYTSTTPVNDLDVIWEVPESTMKEDLVRKIRSKVGPDEFDPSEILENTADSLRASYKKMGRSVRIKTQSHSVGIYFGEDDEFSIDLVPAIASGAKNEYDDDVYWVPEIARLSKSRRVQKYSSGESINWLLSDPRGYMEDARILNEQNPSFRKVAKFVRKWRRECKEKNGGEFSLKSFHLELIVNELFKQSPSINSIEGLQDFFGSLTQYLDAPCFPDRADNSRCVDDYIKSLDQKDKDALKKWTDSASSDIESAINAVTESGIRAALDRILSGASSITPTLSFNVATTFEPHRQYGTDL